MEKETNVQVHAEDLFIDIYNKIAAWYNTDYQTQEELTQSLVTLTEDIIVTVVNTLSAVNKEEGTTT